MINLIGMLVLMCASIGIIGIFTAISEWRRERLKVRTPLTGTIEECENLTRDRECT